MLYVDHSGRTSNELASISLIKLCSGLQEIQKITVKKTDIKENERNIKIVEFSLLIQPVKLFKFM